MNATVKSRKLGVSFKPGPGQPLPPMVTNRPLFGYWTLLAPYFRGVLLAPLNRPDEGTHWTWTAPADATAPSPAEFATLRQRLAGAREAFADACEEPSALSTRPDTILAVHTCMDSVVTALLGLPDSALAGYVARTDRGVFLHSWGLPAPLPVRAGNADFTVTGRVLVNASPASGYGVTLRREDGTPVVVTDTGPDGDFIFSQVAAGTYRVSAQSRPPEAIFPEIGEVVEIVDASPAAIELHNTGSQPNTIGGGRSQVWRRRLPLLLGLCAALALLATCSLRRGKTEGPSAADEKPWQPNLAPTVVAAEETAPDPEIGTRPVVAIVPEKRTAGVPIGTPREPEPLAVPVDPPLPNPADIRVPPDRAETSKPAGISGIHFSDTSTGDTTSPKADAAPAPPATDAETNTQEDLESGKERGDRSGEPPDHSAPAIITAPRPPPATALPLRTVLRLTPWQPRLLRDAIVPTLPTRDGQDDALRELGLRTLGEREIRKPDSLQPDRVLIGVDFVWEATGDASHWRWVQVEGASPLIATAIPGAASVVWRGAVTRSELHLRDETGQTLVRLLAEPTGGLRIYCPETVTRWPSLALEQTPAAPGQVSWSVLGSAPPPQTWAERMDPDRPHLKRLELHLPAAKPETAVVTLAAVDLATGWALTTEVEQEEKGLQ